MAKAKDSLGTEAALRALKGSIPTGRANLNAVEKQRLVQELGGPRTVRDILKAKKDFPLERIPFLFSSLDTQAVVDVLCNDMEEAIAEALAKPLR